MKSYELIESRLNELKISRSKFAAEGLGYKNINKGLRMLDRIMEGGEIPLKCINNISRVLQIPSELVINSIIETEKENKMKEEQEKQMRINKERLNFKPYFYSINERSVPSPIIIGNMVHNQRFVFYYKEFADYTLREQLVHIKFDIAEHYSRNNRGIPAFGKILYYVYRYNYDLKDSELIILNTAGELIKDKDGLRVNEGQPAGIFIRKRKYNLEKLLKERQIIIDRRN